MDSPIGNSSQKRKHDEDSEQNEQKKNRTPEEANAVTKITDVNDDCLEHIFKHLKLRDLPSLADSCKGFQRSVGLAFANKCNGKVLKFHPNCCSFDRLKTMKLFGNIVQIFGLSNCLKVLRHFGSTITKLVVHYFQLNRNQKAAMSRYMNEYCADALIDIELWHARTQVVANWTKPFSKAKSIELNASDLGDLNPWFPMMRRLVLRDDVQSIKNTFPHLEELEIYAKEYKCKKELVAEMLRLNPHLQKLRLSHDGFDMKFIESLSGCLQSLKILDVHCGRGFFNLEHSTVHLKRVNELCMYLDSMGPMVKIPFSFDQLEKMQLTIYRLENFDLNNNLVNFIKQNPSLAKLTIQVRSGLNNLSADQMKIDIFAKFEGLDVEWKPF